VIKLLRVAAVAAAAALPCLAHHSLAADFDVSRPLLLQGVVTRLDWMNPHVRFFMDVRGESGKVTNWEFELGSPNALMRSGWNRNSLRIGEEITVKGCRAKDNAHQGNATSILSRDGRPILAGTADGQDLVAR
jgi:hypothetical protein